MTTLANGSSVTLTLTDYDSVTITTQGVATVTAGAGLGIPAGKLGEFTGTRTFGPYMAGQLTIAASVTGCLYEVADGVRQSASSVSGALATITGTYAVGYPLTATYPTDTVGTIQFYRALVAAPFTKTSISGAVANAVSSLAYTLQNADLGYKIGVDCSNQISSATGLSVSATLPGFGYARKVMGLSMPFGDLVSGALTSNSSWRTVRRFAAPFKRLRCYLFNLDATNPMTGAKACWSPSESLANGFRPTIGGVVSDASSQRFLFGGQLTTTLPVTPTPGIPSVTVSDWLVTPSIATTDGNPNPIGYFTTLFTSGAQVGYAQPGATFQNYVEGLAGQKHAFRNGTCNSDCVETPSSFVATGDARYNMPMLIEVEYYSGVRSMIACGDSTLQGTGNTANAGAALMSEATLDGLNMPMDVSVIAQSGSTAARQDLKLKNIVVSNIPDVIYFQPFSVNDSSNYAGSSAAAKARIDYWISWCAANGVNLVLDTPTPIITAGGTAISGSELAALTDMSTYVLSKASDTVKVLNLTPFHSSQYSGVWSATYGFDNYHPNPTGHQYRAARLVEAIQAFG